MRLRTVGWALAACLLASCTSHQTATGPAVALPSGAAVPTGYHIVYSVTSSSGSVTTEQLWVSRPFLSRDESRSNPPPGGAALSVVVGGLGRQLLNASGGATPGVLEVPPAPAPNDIRFDPVAADALKSGVVVAKGNMTVADRRCRVYSSAATLLSTVMTGSPAFGDHVDTCVDSEGLVLDEQTVAGGHLTGERRAVTVEVGTQAGDSGDYTGNGTRIPLSKGGGRTQAITLTSRPPGEPFWNLASPPGGFSHVGRYAVVPPQPPSLAASTISVSIDDVFVSGPDVIVVEQGPGKGPVNAPTGGTDVDLGVLGRGRLALSAVGSSVLGTPASNVYVQVRGTVPPATLESIAKSLVQEPPGTLETIPTPQ